MPIKSASGGRLMLTLLKDRSTQSALLFGTALQLIMITAGHVSPPIATLFGPVGVTISLAAGLVYGLRAPRRTVGMRALAGGVVGGGCALIGIWASFVLGDVPAIILAFGTASSAIAGMLGAVFVRAWEKTDG